MLLTGSSVASHRRQAEQFPVRHGQWWWFSYSLPQWQPVQPLCYCMPPDQRVIGGWLMWVVFFILCLVQQKSTHSYESCHLGVCINSSGNLSNECRDVRWSCRCGLNLEERLVNVLICVGWEHPEALSSFLCFHEILHYLWVWEGKFLCCTLYWNNFFFVSSLNETGLVLSVPSYREIFHFIRSTEDQIKVLSHGMSRTGSFQVCWLQLLPHL